MVHCFSSTYQYCFPLLNYIYVYQTIETSFKLNILKFLCHALDPAGSQAPCCSSRRKHNKWLKDQEKGQEGLTPIMVTRKRQTQHREISLI